MSARDKFVHVDLEIYLCASLTPPLPPPAHIPPGPFSSQANTRDPRKSTTSPSTQRSGSEQLWPEAPHSSQPGFQPPPAERLMPEPLLSQEREGGAGDEGGEDAAAELNTMNNRICDDDACDEVVPVSGMARVAETLVQLSEIVRLGFVSSDEFESIKVTLEKCVRTRLCVCVCVCVCSSDKFPSMKVLLVFPFVAHLFLLLCLALVLVCMHANAGACECACMRARVPVWLTRAPADPSPAHQRELLSEAEQQVCVSSRHTHKHTPTGACACL